MLKTAERAADALCKICAYEVGNDKMVSVLGIYDTRICEREQPMSYRYIHLDMYRCAGIRTGIG